MASSIQFLLRVSWLFLSHAHLKKRCNKWYVLRVQIIISIFHNCFRNLWQNGPFRVGPSSSWTRLSNKSDHSLGRYLFLLEWAPKAILRWSCIQHKSYFFYFTLYTVKHITNFCDFCRVSVTFVGHGVPGDVVWPCYVVPLPGRNVHVVGFAWCFQRGLGCMRPRSQNQPQVEGTLPSATTCACRCRCRCRLILAFEISIKAKWTKWKAGYQSKNTFNFLPCKPCTKQ